MKGSHSNNHSFTSGTFYPHADGQMVGYFIAVEGTMLLHPDHGEIIEGKKLREMMIPAGTYQIIKQAEQTHSGMIPVQD